MHLSLDTGTATYKIRAYTAEYIQVNETRIEHSVIVSPERIVYPWGVETLATLQAHQLEPLWALEPNVVLLGTGRQLIFPLPEWYTLFFRRRIGIEVMNTAAACRTYAVLMAEGRKVAAALLLD